MWPLKLLLQPFNQMKEKQSNQVYANFESGGNLLNVVSFIQFRNDSNAILKTNPAAGMVLDFGNPD